MHLFQGALSPTVQALAVIALAVTAAWRTWVTYRKTVFRERARTSRLTQAIDGASPRERPEIIRACSLLEAASRQESDDSGRPGVMGREPGGRPAARHRSRSDDDV